jgi:hypothetical protein
MGDMPGQPFVSGADLSGAFYTEVVRPLLVDRPHAAGLLGWGSDVLGYDTERSTDHGWGPRLVVFLEGDDAAEGVETMLADELPEHFRGWPVRFGWDAVPVSHHVTVTTLSRWLEGQLGVDATHGMTLLDWLLTPQQQLLGVVAGALYADGSGALRDLRESLAWYPDQVWRWLVSCQWHRLGEEEAFVARTAEVGDESGSTVSAARAVRDIMRLALLLERRYAPYQKWLGTAFAAIPRSDGLPSQLADALHASDATRREAALAGAYTAIAHRHNATCLTDPLATTTGPFYSRPAAVLMAGRFGDATAATVTDPRLRALPRIGAVDQIVDNAQVLSTPSTYRRLAGLFGDTLTGSVAS